MNANRKSSFRRSKQRTSSDSTDEQYGSSGRYCRRVCGSSANEVVDSVSATSPDKSWLLIRNSVEAILLKKMTTTGYETLYRACYKMVVQKCGNFLYKGLEGMLQNHLKQFKLDLLDENCVDAVLLSKIQLFFDDYLTSLSLIRDIFIYLDKAFVKTQPHLADIYTMGICQFRQIVLENSFIEARLLELILTPQNNKSSMEVRVIVLTSLFELLSVFQIHSCLTDSLQSCHKQLAVNFSKKPPSGCSHNSLKTVRFSLPHELSAGSGSGYGRKVGSSEDVGSSHPDAQQNHLLPITPDESPVTSSTPSPVPSDKTTTTNKLKQLTIITTTQDNFSAENKN